tara:strand:+ start:20 stop:553 length:534 start_codon:yes stop_codon:yes gene_type:complete
MGYTHYWRQLRDFTDTEWQELTRLAKLITADGRGVLARHPYDEHALTIDDESIYFNGIGDEGHETFCITKKKRPKADYEEQEAYDRQGAFEFCKTAHKPYDKYVVAVLCALYNIEVKEWPLGDGKIMSISSDGNTKDWTEGLFHAVRSTRQEEMYCPIRDCLTLSYVDYVDQQKKTG